MFWSSEEEEMHVSWTLKEGTLNSGKQNSRQHYVGEKGRELAKTQESAPGIHEGLTEVEPCISKSVQARKGHVAGAFSSRQRTVKSVGSIPEKLNGETVSFKIKAIPPFSSGQWNTEQRVWSWLPFPLPDPLYNLNISKFSSWLPNCRGVNNK